MTEDESKKGVPEINVPEYVQFVKLVDKNAMDQAVEAFFGIQNFTTTHFMEHFGIDLAQYKNFYFEVGITDELIGPALVGKVSPILVVKQNKDGSFQAMVMKHEGFINLEYNLAFIDAKAWDKFVGDTLMQEVEEAMRRQLEAVGKLEKDEGDETT